MKLTYKIEKEIEREYGAEAICGYLRSPKIHNGRVTGLCALCEGWKCKRLHHSEQKIAINIRRNSSNGFYTIFWYILLC